MDEGTCRRVTMAGSGRGRGLGCGWVLGGGFPKGLSCPVPQNCVADPE